jgi:hypothetical protein
VQIDGASVGFGDTPAYVEAEPDAT